MNKQAPTKGRLFVIIGFALSCFGLLLFLWLAFGGPVPLKPKGYRFQVSFDDATTLAEQSDVRVAGVSVGKVVAKKRDPQGNRTLATVQLDTKYAPPHTDARAILRQKTLLGETYVEMTLGSRRAPVLPDGGRLDNAQVAPAVEFDELLRIFDRPTRAAFQRWQQSLAKATGGRATDLNDALGNLPGFVEGADGVVGTLDRRREALGSLVRNTGVTFAALTRNESALQRLITRNTQVFSTLADHRRNLSETFRVFPTFLRESRTTLRRLQTFSTQTDPLVRDLKPVLRDARPTLASLRMLAPDAQALFTDLDPLITAGRTGLPALSRVLRGLDPTLASLEPFLQQLNPLLQFLELNQAYVADFLNTGPTALGIKVPKPPGFAGAETSGHALPQLIVTGDQSITRTDRRSDTNRGNSYLPPSGLAGSAGDAAGTKYKSGFFTFPNFDCDNAGGEHKADPGNGSTNSGTQGCFVANRVQFQGTLTRYPRVKSGGAGGVSTP